MEWSGATIILTDVADALLEHEIAPGPEFVGRVFTPPRRCFGTGLGQHCDGDSGFDTKAGSALQLAAKQRTAKRQNGLRAR